MERLFTGNKLSDVNSEHFEVTSPFAQPGETPVWTTALTEPSGEQGAVGGAKKVQVKRREIKFCHQ